jgi:flagellar hook-associated protein 3
MRITQNILINNFLRNLNAISERIERTQEQLSTGKKFSRPGHGPLEVGQVIGFRSDSSKISQYLSNVDDGTSQVSYIDTIVQSVISDLGRTRDLAIDGANDNLNAQDRAAIAQEVSLLLDATVSNANSRFRDRYTFAGWNTRSQPFEAVYNENTGFIEDVIYHGNRGNIDRLVGDKDQLTVNINGKELFLEQTYAREGRVLPSGIPLGFSGTITINEIDFNITKDQTLDQIALMINGASNDTLVFATAKGGRIILESATAVSEFTISDNKNNELLNALGLHVKGAFNSAVFAPTLPLTDSTPAIFIGDGPVSTLTFDSSNNTLNIFLGADANGGISKASNIIIKEGTYSDVAELIDEIQGKIDIAFGEDKILVSDAGGGVLQLETVATGDEIGVGDLVIGGPFNGLDDTASAGAALNLIAGPSPAPATNADIAGTDGNDKIIIDLGPTTSKNGLDVLPQVVDIDASLVTNETELLAEIQRQIFNNEILRGAVEVSLLNGKLEFESSKKGSQVLAEDFQITDGATGTLTALGLSDVPIQAIISNIPAFPFIVVAGFNDTLTIDIGPSVSLDGTNPDPVTITIPPGIYNNPPPQDIVSAIQSGIAKNPALNGAITVSLNGGTLSIQSTKAGSEVQGSDLVISGALAGTIFGADPATAISGGGSSDGLGDELQPNNIFNTLITVRDDNLGVGWKFSGLFDVQNQNQDLLGLVDGDIITVKYDAGTFDFNVLSSDTLKYIVNNLQEIFGSRAYVSLTGDGRISIRNLETYQIYNIEISAKGANGGARPIFDAIFSELPEEIPGLTTSSSLSMRDNTRFKRLGDQDLALLDTDLENLLRAEAVVGSRGNRLATITDLFSAQGLNIEGLRQTIEASNFAEVLTTLSQQELVLQSSLGVGARVLPPSLLDFL